MVAHETTTRVRCTRSAAVLAAALNLMGCVARGPAADAPVLRIVPHAAWEAQPPLGHAADALRRNLGPGDRLEFGDLVVEVVATEVDSTDAESSAAEAPGQAAGSADVVQLRLAHAGAHEERRVPEGAAFVWRGYRIAVVAIHGRTN